MAKKLWYVVHVHSGFEKAVEKHLVERILRSPIQECFGQILIPVEEVVESKKGGGRSITERRFYPGYILIEMELTENSWHLVRRTPRVFNFVVGVGNKPVPISQEEVTNIMRQMVEGAEKPRPKVSFEVGEVVRIKDGPFTDFHGNVEEVQYGRSRVRLSVTIFGRSTPVELEFSQIEKT